MLTFPPHISWMLRSATTHNFLPEELPCVQRCQEDVNVRESFTPNRGKCAHSNGAQATSIIDWAKAELLFYDDNYISQ